MSITTYSELKTAVSTWLDDNQFTANAADFITLGENRIRRDFRLYQMEARATTTMDTTSRYVSIPSGFVAHRRMWISANPINKLEFVSQDQLDTLVRSGSGLPQYYTITGQQFEFDIIPDSAYTLEINYYKLTDLSNSNTTNEIFPEYADLYLAAAMCEGLTFLQEDPTAWELKYNTINASIRKYNAAVKYPEGGLRVRAEFSPL